MASVIFDEIPGGTPHYIRHIESLSCGNPFERLIGIQIFGIRVALFVF